MTENNYVIKNMSQENLALAIDWAAQEGWNPGLYDAAAFYACDPQGFFMGFLDGEPISCISAVSYEGRFGFVGFYIVKPGFRGKGYGFQIWQQAMAYLVNHNIGLDGVLAQQTNYQKSGFNLAYRNIRYQTTAQKIEKSQGFQIVSLAEIPFETVLNYDQSVFPANRKTFLTHWLAQPESLALAVLKQNQFCGYGMIRKCRLGYKIGPLFADSPAAAKVLLAEFLQYPKPDTTIFWDVPEINSGAVKIAKEHQMAKVFETARMYTRPIPDIKIGRIFGVTSYELG